MFSCSVAFAAPLRFALTGTDGKAYTSLDLNATRATVLVFLSTDCPISNRYSPLLHLMETEYRRKRVAFFAVFSDPAIHAEAARAHLAEYGLSMTGLMDPGATLARQTGARVTPEAAVLSPEGEVLYRGRIDNRYVDWGKTRNEATQNDLRDALEQILAGKPVAVPVTRSLGCAIAGVN